MNMKINLELGGVPRGYSFLLDGVELVKLDDDGEGSFVVTADALPNTVPFCNDEEVEAPNNYQGSNLHHIIEDWAESRPNLYEALLEREIDLTTMDGMTDYGKPQLSLRSLTVDEYRKYRRFIPLTSRAYWLATGWATLRSPISNYNYAYCVSTSGALSNYNVYGADYYCPRPAFYLKSEIVVSMSVPSAVIAEGDGTLARYTDAELIKELWNRAGRE